MDVPDVLHHHLRQVEPQVAVHALVQDAQGVQEGMEPAGGQGPERGNLGWHFGFFSDIFHGIKGHVKVGFKSAVYSKFTTLHIPNKI